MAVDYTAQFLLLLSSIASGVVFGVICNLIRMFRMLIPHVRLAIFAEDVIFGLICGAVMTLDFYNYSYGKIRLYALVAAFAAAIMWRITVGRLTNRIFNAILNFLKPKIKKVCGFIKIAVDFFVLGVYTAFVRLYMSHIAKRGFGLLDTHVGHDG